MKITIKDVARIANVAPGTVTRALNNYDDINPETKKKILKVVDELGYVPNNSARNLSAKKNINLAILVFGIIQDDELSDFSNNIMRGAYSYLDDLNIPVAVYFLGKKEQDEKKLKDIFSKYSLDGAIIMGLRTDDYYVSYLSEIGKPCVTVDIEIKGENIGSVVTDDKSAFKDLCSLVINHGHKKMILIYGRVNSAVTQKRYEGFKEAIKEHGLDENDQTIIYADFKGKIAYDESKKHIEEYGLSNGTVFVCMSDLTAYGVYQAIVEMGYKVKDDFSVVGYDRINFGDFIFPLLTTVNNDVKRKGEAAAKLLYKMVKKEAHEEQIKIPYEIVKRDSVKENL